MKHSAFFTLLLISILSLTVSLPAQSINELQDTTMWDLELLAFDLQTMEAPQQGLMTMGAFPTQHYQGSAGTRSYHFKVGESEFVGASFFIGKTDKNKHLYQGEDSQKAFFTILSQVDATYPDTNTASHIISRNHPDYIGQGHIQTHGLSLEYLAFSKGDAPATAVVNLKLFDLTKGNTILLAPMPDKSIRVKQLDLGYLSMSGAESQVEDLLKEPTHLEFFEIEAGPVACVNDKQDDHEYRDEVIEVVFTNKLTQADLDRIQAEMKKKQIELSYNETSFSSKGRLKSLSFTVKTELGNEGSASSRTLFLAPIGFLIDYRKDADVAFRVGTIKN